MDRLRRRNSGNRRALRKRNDSTGVSYFSDPVSKFETPPNLPPSGTGHHLVWPVLLRHSRFGAACLVRMQRHFVGRRMPKTNRYAEPRTMLCHLRSDVVAHHGAGCVTDLGR